jgi:four helix bundle protein
VYSDKGYHKLLVWQKSREFVKEVYLLTEGFPRAEVFGLTSQVRRSSISVILNIVEGDRRRSRKEFYKFLDIADASLVEVEACLEIALDLQYISEQDWNIIEEKRREIAAMQTALIKSIQKSL